MKISLYLWFMDQNNAFNPRGLHDPVDVTKKKKSLKQLFNLTSLFKKPPKKRLAIVGGVGVMMLTAGTLILIVAGPKAAEPNPEPVVSSTYEPPAIPTTIASPLTGVQVSPELAKRPITAVMIENSIDARPQSGLFDAGIVFEAIAEGGITRFMALYQESQPENIGPIRSARPYYVRWAAGFDAAYTHSGGSGEALALIQTLGIKDMDHGRYGQAYFDRVSYRYAPHNVYTSMARLDQLKEKNGFTQSIFTPLSRVKEATDAQSKTGTTEPITPQSTVEPAAKTLTFNISGPLYNTSYTYDETTKTYSRFMAGQQHTDEKSGKQIAPRVVVALIMSYGIHPDGVHSTYQNVGTGKAIVFQNGVVVEGKWEKTDDKASLSLKKSDRTDLQLEPGQVWFSAIQDGRVSYSP
jgi:hypothetical protein